MSVREYQVECLHFSIGTSALKHIYMCSDVDFTPWSEFLRNCCMNLQSQTCWPVMLCTSSAMYLNQPPPAEHLEVDSSIIMCLFYRAVALFVRWLHANGSQSFSLFTFWLVWDFSGAGCVDFFLSFEWCLFLDTCTWLWKEFHAVVRTLGCHQSILFPWIC